MTSPLFPKPRRSIDRLVITSWLAVSGATAGLIGSLLPWARSGQTSRSSYALLGVADRLGVLRGSVADLGAVWFLLPILTGCAWLALAAGRRRLATTLCLLVGLLCVVAAEMTRRSPLAVELGASLSTWAGLVAVGAAIAHLIPRRSPSR